MTAKVPRKTPSHRAIVEAQAALCRTLATCSWDVDTAHCTCWACGLYAEDFKPVRAHVVAHGLGGSDDPSNFLLLCDACHRDQPDAQPWPVQEAWLRSREPYAERFRRELAPAFADVPGDITIDDARSLAAIFRECLEAPSAAANPQTTRANAVWAFRERVRAWVAARSRA